MLYLIAYMNDRREPYAVIDVMNTPDWKSQYIEALKIGRLFVINSDKNVVKMFAVRPGKEIRLISHEYIEDPYLLFTGTDIHDILRQLEFKDSHG